MIVVDASAVVEYLLDSAIGKEVGRCLADPALAIAAPSLIDVEVTQAIRRCCFAELIDDHRAGRSIEHLADLSLLRWPHEPLLPRIWSLRFNFTAYDAAYIALAESLDATLLTCDAALTRSEATQCEVQLLG